MNVAYIFIIQLSQRLWINIVRAYSAQEYACVMTYISYKALKPYLTYMVCYGVIMQNTQLHFLNSSEYFTKEIIEDIKKETFHTLDKIYELLPPNNLDVVFSHDPISTIENEYIGGRTQNSNTIFIYFDARYAEFQSVIKNRLKVIIAHEYHHACRWKTVGYGKTLGEALISEGLADHFSQELFNAPIACWCCNLSQDEIEEHSKKAKEEINR